jgi:excisionase family DNA binding protein
MKADMLTTIADTEMEEDDGKNKISEGMLTTTEVATLLRIHPNTVRWWTNKGFLHAVRIGPRRDRRFTQEELTRFIQESSQ